MQTIENKNNNLKEKFANFVDIYAKKNNMTFSVAFKILIDIGRAEGAKTVDEALIKAIKKERKLISLVSEITQINKLISGKIPTAKETNEKLKRNIEMTRDDKLIKEIRSEYLWQDKEKEQ